MGSDCAGEFVPNLGALTLTDALNDALLGRLHGRASEDREVDDKTDIAEQLAFKSRFVLVFGEVDDKRMHTLLTPATIEHDVELGVDPGRPLRGLFGREQVLDAIDKVLIPNAKNAELKALIVKVRPAFVGHLEHAKMIQATLAK